MPSHANHTDGPAPHGDRDDYRAGTHVPESDVTSADVADRDRLDRRERVEPAPGERAGAPIHDDDGHDERKPEKRGDEAGYGAPVGSTIRLNQNFVDAIGVARAEEFTAGLEQIARTHGGGDMDDIDEALQALLGRMGIDMADPERRGMVDQIGRSYRVHAHVEDAGPEGDTAHAGGYRDTVHTREHDRVEARNNGSETGVTGPGGPESTH